METLKRIRTMRGLNQVDLAKASGVSQNTISEIETGRREARPATLRKLANALDIEIADFFEEADRPKAPAPPSSEPTLFNGVLDEERRANEIDRWLAYATLRAGAWEEQAEKEESALFQDWQTATEFDSEVAREHAELTRIVDDDLWGLIGEGILDAERERLAAQLIAAVNELWAAYKKVNTRALAVVNSMAEAVSNTTTLAHARQAAQQRAADGESIVEDINRRRSA